MGRYDTISFLTDYGSADEFVGVVHSVIRQLAPEVRVIDISHHVPAHDIRAGGLTLARSAQYLAPGVVLAVVDPGVGTARRAVAIEVGDPVELVRWGGGASLHGRVRVREPSAFTTRSALGVELGVPVVYRLVPVKLSTQVAQVEVGKEQVRILRLFAVFISRGHVRLLLRKTQLATQALDF